jgi:TRAP-type transport system small permease protein
MKSKLRFFQESWLEIFNCLLLFSMVILVSISVTLRYVFRTGLIWSEELVRYAYIWLIFLGSVTAIKLNAHIGLDLVVERLPLRIKIVVMCLGDLLVMGFVVIQTVYGCSLILKAGGTPSAVMRIPMGWIYIVFPLSGVLMIIEMIHVLRRHWSIGKE